MPLLLGGFDQNSGAVAVLTGQLQIQMQMQIAATRYISFHIGSPQTHALQIVHKNPHFVYMNEGWGEGVLGSASELFVKFMHFSA